MDTTQRTDSIEKESLQLVLEEFTAEQRSNAQATSDLATAINGLSAKFARFEERLNYPNEVNVSVDTKPIQDIIKKGIINMLLTVAGQPKSLTRKFQLLLFPEQDAKLFYKVIFGRWFLMLVIMLFLTQLYKFSIHWSNNRQEIKLRQLENDRINKAWNYLYHQRSKEGKRLKRLMDSAYIKSANGR